MNDAAQKPSHFNRREALQAAAITTAAAASGLTGAASAATPTINVSDRNAGGFWPNGARLAVSLSLMFEGGGQPISGAGGVIPDPIEKGVPDLPTNAFFAYGHYEGIPRVLDLMDKHGIKLSSFMIGKAVDEELVRAAAEIAAKPAKPLDNADLSHFWRKRMVRVVVEQALQRASDQ